MRDGYPLRHRTSVAYDDRPACNMRPTLDTCGHPRLSLPGTMRVARRGAPPGRCRQVRRGPRAVPFTARPQSQGTGATRRVKVRTERENGSRTIMKKLRDLWTDLRSSFWFVPSVIVCAAVTLALALIETDRMLARNLSDSWPRLFGAGAAGSRGMLSAIAGSMITVAGVVFSITIVALSLASSQYSSRVLRNFMHDRANQAVLGVFVGIFAYCLVVLRTVRGGDDGAFVPAVAVLGAVALAFVGIAFLIFFIDHIGWSIQAAQIIAAVAEETLPAARPAVPGESGRPVRCAEGAASMTRQRFRGTIPARRTDDVQRVDVGALIAFARARPTTVRMESRIVSSSSRTRRCHRSPKPGTPTRTRSVRSSPPFPSSGSARRRGRRVRRPAAGRRRAHGLVPGHQRYDDGDHVRGLSDRHPGAVGAPSTRNNRPGDAGELQVIVRRPVYADFVAEAFDQIRRMPAATWR